MTAENPAFYASSAESVKIVSSQYQGGDFESAKSGNFRVELEFGRQSKENLVGEFG